MAEEKKEFQRLPTEVVPSNYALELTPNLKDFTFKGILEITAEVSYQICALFAEWVSL